MLKVFEETYFSFIGRLLTTNIITAAGHCQN